MENLSAEARCVRYLRAVQATQVQFTLDVLANQIADKYQVPSVSHLCKSSLSTSFQPLHVVNGVGALVYFTYMPLSSRAYLYTASMLNVSLHIVHILL
jgi:hypothetical protein